MRLLIVGGDAAGMTVASTVRRLREDAEITVVERGPYTSYSMCGIPYYVGGLIDEAQDLVVRAPHVFRAQGITVHTNTEAIAIDPDERRVTVRDLATGAHRTEPYDMLLYAPGSHPRVPDLPGLAEHGLRASVSGSEPAGRALVVHTLDEGERLRRLLDADGEVRTVAVVGAGYIGLEIAEALIDRGLRVHLIDRGNQVMRSLDGDMAGRLEDVLIDYGVNLHLGERLVELRTDDGRCHQILTDAGNYEADAVVLAMGGEPNVEMAVAAGCEVGTSGALRVDGRMRTTVPGIWAAGDVVESRDLVAGRAVNVQLGTHANKQGKVAAIDIAAQPDDGVAIFPGVVGTAVTRLCQWDVGRVGLTEREARDVGIRYAAVGFTGSARARYMPDAGVVHIKMLAEVGTGRVLGTQLIGTGNVAKRIDVAAVWCQLGVTVQEAQLMDLSYAPPFGGVWDLLQVAARKLTRKLGLSPQL